MNNTEREQIFNEMIENINKELRECDLHIEAPMIVRCNCIVATEDAQYQVGVLEDSKATVLIGNHTSPVWMTEKAAKNLLYEQGFKASNGNGELKFKIWGWKSFYAQRKQNLLKVKADIESLYKMAIA